MTYAILAANVALFFLGMLLTRAFPGRGEQVLDGLTLRPDAPVWWAFITYAFLHAGPGHIFWNSVALWVFGPDVEDRFGRLGFLAFYLLGAVAGGLAHALWSHAPVVGASGAIAAVSGAFLVLFPRTGVRTLVVFFVIGVFTIPAWWYLLFLIAGDFLPFIHGVMDRTSHAAHLGGYAWGVAVPLVLLAFRLIPREPYDLFSIGRQAARRSRFREAASMAERRRPPKLRPAKEPPEVAAARERIATSVRGDDIAGAAAEFLKLRSLPDAPVAPGLGRTPLYEIANHLFRTGDHANAADAYGLFERLFPRDSELGRVRLMQGLIHARYLNDPTQARQRLQEAIPLLRDSDDLALARQIVAELG